MDVFGNQLGVEAFSALESGLASLGAEERPSLQVTWFGLHPKRQIDAVQRWKRRKMSMPFISHKRIQTMD